MSAPLRVLMTADAVGGVWTYALDLVRALAPHGVSVALATMGRLPTPAQCADAEAIPNLTLHPSEFALEWMPDPWDDVQRAGDWLLGLEAGLQPDIVHLNGYVHGALPWRSPVLMAGHSCVLSWWQAVHGEPAPPDWNRYREVVRHGLQAADLVAAPTHSMLDALATHYGPLRNCRVIPNGRDAAAFSSGPNKPLIFSAGRLWDDAKNIQALAEIAPRLPWPVCVAGDTAPPGGTDLRPAHVRLLGCLPPSEIASWLARVSLYALPAKYEPFGLSALEAGLSGCALVLGDIPSLREVWGDAALYADPNDPEALHSGLTRLIADDGLRQDMASRALAHARTYTLERMADGYLSAYLQLLAREGGELHFQSTGGSAP